MPPPPPVPPFAWFVAITLLEMLSDPGRVGDSTAIRVKSYRLLLIRFFRILAPLVKPAINTIIASCASCTIGDVVRDHDGGERHLATGVQEPTTQPVTSPCWIVNPEIDTFPESTWKTRSRALPSMMVLDEPLPVIVTSPLMSRSPVAELSSLAPGDRELGRSRPE